MALSGLAKDMSKVYGAALSDATRNDILGTVGMDQYMSQDEQDKRKKQELEQLGQPSVQKMKKGGKVSSASKRADGCAQRGKTRGRIV